MHRAFKFVITAIAAMLVFIVILFILEHLDLATITVNHYTPTLARQSSWSV